MTKNRRNMGPRTPSLRVHRVRKTAYAYAVFSGEERRYGRLDDDARLRFNADLQVWLENGRRFPVDDVDDGDDDAQPFTVRDLAKGYDAFLQDDKPAAWHANNGARTRLALAALTEHYGDVAAATFGPLKFKAVREHLMQLRQGDGVTPRQSAATMNERMRIIRAAFDWAVSDELVPAAVLDGLKAVKAIRQGRPGTKAKQSVLPVDRAVVDATVPYVSAPVKALIELMWWMGARPKELFGLRPCDLDRSGKVWTAKLTQHKSADKGRSRVLMFGEQCQDVLKPFLLRPAMRYMFRPAEALQGARRPDRVIGEQYDKDSFGKAVRRAIVRANKVRAEQELEPLPLWHPYQLRHSAGTRLRAEHGLEAARVILGHSSAVTTEIYAEADMLAAAKVMESAG